MGASNACLINANGSLSFFHPLQQESYQTAGSIIATNWGALTSAAHWKSSNRSGYFFCADTSNFTTLKVTVTLIKVPETAGAPSSAYVSYSTALVTPSEPNLASFTSFSYGSRTVGINPNTLLAQGFPAGASSKRFCGALYGQGGGGSMQWKTVTITGALFVPSTLSSTPSSTPSATPTFTPSGFLVLSSTPTLTESPTQSATPSATPSFTPSATNCPAGTFTATGSTSCRQCPGGHYCPPGTSSWAHFNCGRGNYCPYGSGAPTPCPYQVPPTGGWGALRVQGPAFLVETAHCLNHCFWNFTSGDGVLSKC